jgi:hypothetical protein
VQEEHAHSNLEDPLGLSTGVYETSRALLKGGEGLLGGQGQGSLSEHRYYTDGKMILRAYAKIFDASMG